MDLGKGSLACDGLAGRPLSLVVVLWCRGVVTIDLQMLSVARARMYVRNTPTLLGILMSTCS